MGRKLAEATNACRMRCTRGEIGRRFLVFEERVFDALAAGLRVDVLLAGVFFAAFPASAPDVV
jgi:hypothetical protein